MYRVLNWDRHFEGAKSKTYNNKTSCSLPTKHGLGYRRLISEKDGVALFGAWVALIQVLSRHNKPRQGYCTDTGLSDGTPYSCEDLELLTGISAKYFKEMFKICKSHSVGWVELTKTTDTTGDCEETLLPLNLDSDSNLNSDLDSLGGGDKNKFTPPTVKEVADEIRKYATEKKLIVTAEYCGITAEGFVDHYENCDWKLNSGRGAKMKSWERSVKKFIRTDYQNGKIARAK